VNVKRRRLPFKYKLPCFIHSSHLLDS